MTLRTINLSEELNNKLKKEVNTSALITNLLTEYYRKVDINALSLEELKKSLLIEELREEMNKRIEEIRNGNV